MTDRRSVKEKIAERLEDMIHRGVIWGVSCGFADENGAEQSFHGVMGGVPPYDHRAVCGGLYYDLASLSKVVGTTSRVMQMVQEGALSLNMPVRSLLPDFLWDGITVGHLLLHNSGLPAEIPDKEQLNRENILKRLYQTEPVAAPGERFLYSDVGYILLGLLIQKGVGLKEHGTLEDIYQKHVFGPLGMEHTSFSVRGKENLCVPTEVTEKRGLICGQVHDSKAWLLGQSGSAGLFSTLGDVLWFVTVYLREDSRLFSKEIFQKIRETNVYGRTYGWSTEYGPDTLYHTGFTGTSILMDLKRREGMVLLTNRIHPSRENPAFLEERKELNRIWLDNQ